MNHSKEKAVPSFAEYIDLFLYTKILKSFWYVPKTWESKIDSSSWIQPLAFHELLHTLRESSLGNISYRDTWHFITACTSHNTDISALKINGYWTLNKTCLFHLHPVLLLSLCSLASRYSASQLNGPRRCLEKQQFPKWNMASSFYLELFPGCHLISELHFLSLIL